MNTINNIEELLDKYWEAETSLEEEKVLKMYFASDNVAEEHLVFRPLFTHFAEVSAVSSLDVEAIIMDEIAREKEQPTMRLEKSKGRVVSIKKYIPMVAAASIVLLVAIVGVNKFYETPSYGSDNSNMIVLESEEDTAEAVRITKEALALLSNGYNKGTKAIMELEHMKVANKLIK